MATDVRIATDGAIRCTIISPILSTILARAVFASTVGLQCCSAGCVCMAMTVTVRVLCLALVVLVVLV